MEKKQLISFVRKGIKFLMCFLLLDISLGTIAEYFFFKQKSGKYARITYSLEKVNADILIFGSSHANRHYVPSVFEKKLHISCYNAGVQGQQILFHSAIEEIITNRVKPKIIILNIDNDWLFESEESYERLSNLNPYYSKHSQVLKPIFDLKSKVDCFALYLKSYRLNSTMVHIIKYFIQPQPTEKGYNPLYGKMSQPTSPFNTLNTKKTINIEKRRIDTNFVNAFNKFIQIAKKDSIQLFLVSSPTIYGTQVQNESTKRIRKIIQNQQISFIDFSNDTSFVNKYELFNDANHLNNTGAILFSSLLSDSIYTKINKR